MFYESSVICKLDGRKAPATHKIIYTLYHHQWREDEEELTQKNYVRGEKFDQFIFIKLVCYSWHFVWVYIQMSAFSVNNISFSPWSLVCFAGAANHMKASLRIAT